MLYYVRKTFHMMAVEHNITTKVKGESIDEFDVENK